MNGADYEDWSANRSFEFRDGQMVRTQAPRSTRTAFAQEGRTPPYDSDLEARLAYAIRQLIEPERRFYKQFPVTLTNGVYHVDLVLDSPRGLVGLECDSESHKRKYWRDRIRDALILGHSEITCIYRLQSDDIKSRLALLLLILVEFESDLFPDAETKMLRWVANLFWKVEFKERSTTRGILFDHLSGREVSMERLSKREEDGCSAWRDLFRFAKAFPRLPPGKIAERWERQMAAGP
jgi:hypothetical protein